MDDIHYRGEWGVADSGHSIQDELRGPVSFLLTSMADQAVLQAAQYGVPIQGIDYPEPGDTVEDPWTAFVQSSFEPE